MRETEGEGVSKGVSRLCKKEREGVCMGVSWHVREKKGDCVCCDRYKYSNKINNNI